MPAARRIARPSIANGEPAPSESPIPNSTSPRSGCRCTHSTNSWRRRDLPTPAAPDDQHRRRHRFGHRPRVEVRQHRHLAPAADEVGRLAEQVALAPRTCRARRAGTTRCRRAGSRSACRAARPPRRPGGSRRARSRAAGACRCRSPRPPPTRPRTAPAPSTPPAERRGARRASPARSARRAPPDPSPCRRSGSVSNDRAVGQRVQARPVHAHQIVLQRRRAGAAAPRLVLVLDRPTAAPSRPASAAPPSTRARR